MPTLLFTALLLIATGGKQNNKKYQNQVPIRNLSARRGRLTHESLTIYSNHASHREHDHHQRARAQVAVMSDM